MQQPNDSRTVNHPSSVAAIDSSANIDTSNKTLRQTYRLLSLTLGFSAITAAGSAALNLPHPGIVITLVGFFGLLFLTNRLANSAWGLLSIFGLTGFMGYTVGPILNAYLSLANGATLVATAATTTAVAFLGLSAYAKSSNAVDVSKYRGLLFTGVLVAFCLGLAAIFFQIYALSLAVSGLFVLLMCGLIVYETQNIISGGETNYILATVSLFVSIYNLFLSLLHLLGFLGGED